MEKEVGAICPNCGFSGLNIYYDDGASTPLGAKCDLCDFNGLFLKNELIPLPTKDGYNEP